MSAADITFDLTITGDRSDLTPVSDALRTAYDVSERPVADAQKLQLDVGDVAAIVALVLVFLTGEPLVLLLLRSLGRRRKSRVVVQTTFGRATFETDEELTKEQVREVLEVLGGVFR